MNEILDAIQWYMGVTRGQARRIYFQLTEDNPELIALIVENFKENAKKCLGGKYGNF